MSDNETRKKERDRLIRLYYERDKEFESAKGKRMIITILAFSLLYFVVFFQIGYIADVTDFLMTAVISIVFGGIHFWVNALIFSRLFQKGKEEREALEYIERKIRELEKCDSD